MKYIISGLFILLFITMTAAVAYSMGQGERDIPARQEKSGMKPEEIRTAVFAGGCFWGVEGVFERVKGVWEVTSGYAGGTRETAHYDLVGSGTTGHAESVRILYDPSIISYETLLKVFFTVAHDPTQLNYQGPDTGPQYRSAIFYVDDEQKRSAEEYITTLNQEKVFSKPVVTRVVPLTGFFPAEEYHQDFLDRNPDYPYIVYRDLPKLRHLAEKYPELIAK